MARLKSHLSGVLRGVAGPDPGREAEANAKLAQNAEITAVT